MWRFHSPKISVVQFQGRSIILDLDTVLAEGFILMVCERDFRPLGHRFVRSCTDRLFMKD